MTNTAITKNKTLLRFPDFNSEWELKKIGSILSRYSEPVEVDSNELYQEIGIRSHGRGIFHKEPVTGKSLGNKRVFWVKEDLFILNIVFAWEQAVAITSNDERGFIASHRFPMYKPKENILDLKFILYLFLTERGKYLLEMASPGGAGRNKTLGQKAFDELEIRIPSINEQQKISGFLSKFDDLIFRLDLKINYLKEYKKGLCHKLFSGEKRFKNENGQDFQDWKTISLGKVLSIPQKEKPEIIDRSKIFTVKLHRKGISKSKNTENLSLGATYYIRKAGQFIYGKQNLFNGAFGIVPIKFDNGLTSGDIPALDIDNDKIDSRYLIQFLGRETYYSKLEAIASGTGSKRIHEKALMGLKIKLPSLEEQKKIADLLDNVDNEIQHFDNKLKSIKRYRKGLLQKMFM
jgi:type I restriction enzyme S subunit